MDKPTKQCPYCGEDIMASAKKCKHCGEWLDRPVERSAPPRKPVVDQTVSQNYYAPKESGGKTQVDSLDSPVGSYAAVLYWVGLIGYFIVFLHGMKDWYGVEHLGSEGHPLNILTLVPSWLGLLAYALAYLVLFIGFYNGLKEHSSKIAVWILVGVVWDFLYAVILLAAYDDLQYSYDAQETIMGLQLLASPVSLVLSIVPGVMILGKFEGMLKRMGQFLLFGGIVYFITDIVDVAAEEGSFATLLNSFVVFVLACIPLEIFKRLLAN